MEACARCEALGLIDAAEGLGEAEEGVVGVGELLGLRDRLVAAVAGDVAEVEVVGDVIAELLRAANGDIGRDVQEVECLVVVDAVEPLQEALGEEEVCTCADHAPGIAEDRGPARDKAALLAHGDERGQRGPLERRVDHEVPGMKGPEGVPEREVGVVALGAALVGEFVDAGVAEVGVVVAGWHAVGVIEGGVEGLRCCLVFGAHLHERQLAAPGGAGSGLGVVEVHAGRFRGEVPRGSRGVDEGEGNTDGDGPGACREGQDDA